ncbi:pyridoxamine 5'-phosphate oxidase family protein [Limnobacter humi]|uniref:Pyridoxamine 5'-phosphate oxidase family protein n=1 Tax=Limnobacter humi TaxID=1778671 RepID=A0ABT1WJJ8_9BURK|nr:pyridoxamine 5'-phosphate oxidase family protein [Limnobacter humi]MCQ8897693.1 pyridoxamine 5'-phosphate oxidase family protein [Limnobacter humi]
MGHAFADIAFTDTVKSRQLEAGSRERYAALQASSTAGHALGPREKAFIESRDHFFQATVSETGWPYVQHRGGPQGFIQVLGTNTLRVPDFRGNAQFVSDGNLQGNNRIALILMDYAQQKRLKILGNATLLAEAERHWRIDVVAFDWNCPKYITPRFTETEITAMIKPLHDRITQLESLLSRTPQP